MSPLSRARHRLLHQVRLPAQFDQQLFVVALAAQDLVFRRRVGGDQLEVVVAEAFDGLDLRGILLEVELQCLRGAPQLAAAVQSFVAGVAETGGLDILVIVDVPEPRSASTAQPTGA